MTQQDARERAIYEATETAWRDHAVPDMHPRDFGVGFKAGADWQKREDEQRIAALVAAAQQVVDDYLAGVPMLRVSITELRRTLAGQTDG